MKKLAALFLALCLIFSLACAEDALTKDYTPYTLNDIGMCFYVPADVTEGTPDTENAEIFVASNNHMMIDIIVANSGDVTMDDLAAALTEEGYVVEANGLAEAGIEYDHLCVSLADDNTYGAVVFLGTDGCYYMFQCIAADDEGAAEFAVVMLSIQPIEQ